MCDCVSNQSLSQHAKHRPIAGDETKDETDDDLDFSPSHVFEFEVPGKEKSCLYERIDLDDEMDLNGAFFVKDGTDIGLVVSIEGQKEALYYTKTPISDGKFRLKVSESADYSFCFNNEYSTHVKRVVFAVDVVPGVSVEEMLKREHLEPTKSTLKRLSRLSKVLDQGTKYMGMRLKNQANVQDTMNYNVVWWSVVESVVVIAMTAGQVYYIRRMVNNRKTLL